MQRRTERETHSKTDTEMETWRKAPGNTRSVSGSHGGKDIWKLFRASDPETKLEGKWDQDLKRPKMGSETLRGRPSEIQAIEGN